MSGDDAESGSQALREFASAVIRENVDGAHLVRYMRRLLNEQLTELPASVRYEAFAIARRSADWSTEDLARHLYAKARQLERSQSKRPADRSTTTPAPQSPPKIHRNFWILVTASIVVICCIAVEFSLPHTHGDAHLLRVATVGAYGLLALFSMIALIGAVW
jgi:hypothetical protein